MKRREFLGWAVSSAGVLLSGACATSPPVTFDAHLTAILGCLPYRGLATSLPEEQDYEARIEGRIPDDLRGTLYRNGPGLFERAGLRKRSILDGDGMVQQFRIHDDGVHYRTCFVKTEKYLAESSAGKFIYPSWSTQAPGGWLDNFWMTGEIRSQAGITVYLVNGRLYTFDESSYPYELDPVSLKTIGETSLGIPREDTIYSAHSKIDPNNGEWLHFGVRYGTTPQLHVSVFHADGRLNYHRVERLPRFVYIHDWFVSTNYLIASLHPVEIDFWPTLLGFRSISDSLRWRPEKGNLLLVIPRDPIGAPIQIEAPACFMWHSINACDDGTRIEAEFVGYDNPDHFVGKDPIITAIMQGREGEHRYPGLLRRYRIDLQRRQLRSEVLSSCSYEWPRIDNRLLCSSYRYVWLAEARQGDFFWTKVARHDIRNGVVDRFDFGEYIYCSEPLFVPKPNAGYEEGWILTECLDGTTGKAFLAVLDASRLAAGPRAVIHLSHHIPFSYHGWWQAGRG